MAEPRRFVFATSLRIGTLFGVPVRLHFTFLMVAAFLIWEAFADSQSAAYWLAVLALLLVCVLLHELGHAWMAGLCGIPTVEILLLPIGGLTRFERAPRGGNEVMIALAGPAVNLALALSTTIVGLQLGFPQFWRPQPGDDLVSLLWTMSFVNFALTGFNLLPAFPMDGGRALRGLLSFALPLARATWIAARIGQAVALALALFGLLTGNPALLVVAFLVFLGAGREAVFQRASAALAGRVAEEVVERDFRSVAPQDTLAAVARELLESKERFFPVIDVWGRPAGLLTRAQLLAHLADPGEKRAVLEIMARDLPRAGLSTPLTEVALLLQSSDGLPVLVIEDDRLVGLVTAEQLGDML